jgi:hypothetical protein
MLTLYHLFQEMLFPQTSSSSDMSDGVKHCEQRWDLGGVGSNNLQSAGREVVEVIFRTTWRGGERAGERPGKSGSSWSRPRDRRLESRSDGFLVQLRGHKGGFDGLTRQSIKTKHMQKQLATSRMQPSANLKIRCFLTQGTSDFLLL